MLLMFGFGQKISLQSIYFWFFIFTYNKNSVDLTVLFSYYFSI
jgi:hypothetical protein